MGCIVEIICIGNELLIGKIVNTNAQWLAKRVTCLGGHIKRISVVDDCLDEISLVLKESLLREPSVIVTTGGLGPTFDDVTLEAIARALEVSLEVNEEALNMVKEKYRQYEIVVGKTLELIPERVKMARLPKDARPLRNPVGTAPGVILATEKSKLIALPGVPREMKAIFDDKVKPLIKEEVGNLFFYEKSLKVMNIMESMIAPLIDEVMQKNPHVYIKSHPRGSEIQSLIELHFTTASESSNEAKKRINRAVEKISNLISKHGGKIGVSFFSTSDTCEGRVYLK